MPRTKKTVVQPPSKDELPEIMETFAKAESEIKALEGKEELELLEIRKRYVDLAKSANQKRTEAIGKLEAFGLQNRDKLFTEKRSLPLPHGTIGFRLGQHKIAKPKSLTWDKAATALTESHPDLIRTKVEVDKEKIISQRENKVQAGELAKIGLTVVQEETFFISLKEEVLTDA